MNETTNYLVPFLAKDVEEDLAIKSFDDGKGKVLLVFSAPEGGFLYDPKHKRIKESLIRDINNIFENEKQKEVPDICRQQYLSKGEDYISKVNSEVLNYLLMSVKIIDMDQIDDIAEKIEDTMGEWYTEAVDMGIYPDSNLVDA